MMIKKSLVFIALLGVLSGCGVKSPQIQGPPEKFQSLSDEVSEESPLPDPKVNILFVVDNSGSMKDYQNKMAENIELFANAFFENTRIDYRIGVVPVYDSKYLNDEKVYAKNGRRKMNPLGELVTLKDAAGVTMPGELFITRATPSPKAVLKNTVTIGVQWGPEAEESFSPVLAVTDPEHNVQKNNGFYESDAYFAVIFLTDADDVTPGVSAESFYQHLVGLKGGDRSKVLIAAALPDLKNPRLNKKGSDCKTDGLGPIQAFPALLSVSGGIFADLCSENFGFHLAAFGNHLAQRVAAQKKPLKFTPDIKTLKVTYGTKDEIKPFELLRPRDYAFDPETNEIILDPYLKLPVKEGATLRIQAKPVSLGNLKNGRVNPISIRR
ncbi:MAG: VWA domain-containing protein [Bdellovibrionaceae bacterium]|nr:VWA domain-containing protein [Pseudobdellovibrionaceae bacterium]